MKCEESSLELAVRSLRSLTWCGSTREVRTTRRELHDGVTSSVHDDSPDET